MAKTGGCVFRFEDSDHQTTTFSPKVIVVKVGSNILCGADGRLDRDYIQRLSDMICAFQDGGAQVALVSSGAIAAGLGLLGMKKHSRSIPESQALAAVGQSRLMQVYGETFGLRGRHVAQILLTRLDLEDRARYLNARRALETIFSLGIVPIINENDTTVVDEIKFGGNDILSAVVATKLKADLLILLTNVNGLYAANPVKCPDAPFISQVTSPRDIAEAVVTDGVSPLGTGGMTTKLQAACLATDGGVHAMIANGRGEGVLESLPQGQLAGTFFVAQHKRRKTSWANWILSARRHLENRIVVDAGARTALVEGNKSLLPAGVLRAEGDFREGDVVEVVDEGGRVLARGAVNYSQGDVEKIKGLKSSQIEKVLGYKLETTVIHRDNLVVLE